LTDKILPYPDYKLFYLLTMGSKLARRMDKTENSDESVLETAVIKQIDWYREILTMLYWYNGVSDARSIRCPVLALHGCADRQVPCAEADATRGIIPQTVVKTFDRAGHDLVFSRAKECVEEIRGLWGR
jgi:pimeloyl-ACP methyl ester carboxylesterase